MVNILFILSYHLLKCTFQICPWWGQGRRAEGTGRGSERPHTAPASACRLLLQFKSVAQHPANVSLLLSSAWQRLVCVCVCVASLFYCYLRHRLTYKKKRFSARLFTFVTLFQTGPVRQRLAPCEGFAVRFPRSTSLDYTVLLSCPRDQNSSTHPAHKPSFDVTDYIRMHIRA